MKEQLAEDIIKRVLQLVEDDSDIVRDALAEDIIHKLVDLTEECKPKDTEN